MLSLLSQFFKKYIKKKLYQPSEPPPTWGDILESKTTSIQKTGKDLIRSGKDQTKSISSSDRRQRTALQNARGMLLPSRVIMMWKTDETPLAKKKPPKQPGVNVMFKFQYKDKSFFTNMRRPLDQGFHESVVKIRANMLKRVEKQFSTVEAAKAVDAITFINDYEVDEDATILDFLESPKFDHLTVNSEQFRILRRAPPVTSLSLSCLPIPGSIILPSIDFNEEANVDPHTYTYNYHWFIKNSVEPPVVQKPNGKIIPQGKVNTTVNFIDEEKRLFELDNHSYRKSGQYYEPIPEDEGRLISVVLDMGSEEPVCFATSVHPASSSPGELVTDEQLEWCRMNPIDQESDIIRVMTYNILAGLYLNLTLEQDSLFFPYCDKEYQRTWYRSPLILKQVKDFLAETVSILFIQELDVHKYTHFFVPLLKSLGYGIEFSRKRLAVGEGIAMVYDKKRFEMIESHTFGLSELIAEEPENENIRRILKTMTESGDRVLSRPTVVQIVLLEDLKNKNLILVANTHLHHDPKEEHIKLLQSLAALRKMLKMRDEYSIDRKRSLKLIFGGDFNSMPDGPVFELYSNGKIDDTHICWKCEESISSEVLKTPMNQKMICLSATPKYTNYTKYQENNGFIGCIDYIWGLDFSSIRVCPMPRDEIVTKYKALPSKIAPSDHLPLIVDIKY